MVLPEIPHHGASQGYQPRMKARCGCPVANWSQVQPEICSRNLEIGAREAKNLCNHLKFAGNPFVFIALIPDLPGFYGQENQGLQFP